MPQLRVLRSQPDLGSVSDSGPGVDPAIAEAIFEPFHRGPTQASGSGVGLAVVRYTAEAHRGFATVQTSDLGGSEFKLSIPRRT